MTPSRPSVRALLAKVLCADSDLDAFCGDYFEDVYARFTSGMDRVGKVNQLFDRVGTSRIVAALRRAHPDAVREHETVLEFAPATPVTEPPPASNSAPTPLYPDEATRLLSKQLERARARKRTLTQVGADTSQIDREILHLRRQLREGGQLREGDALSDGRYSLIRRVGRGGFAVVWEAHDEQRQQRVAIKVLHSESVDDRIRRERFFRGARIMAELADDAIVRVLEPHAEEGGFHYFVMELLAGGDLRAAVLAGRLGGEALLEAILRVGGALAKAHARGFVHRDIKPANILLDASGAPRLTDFDLVGGADTTGGTRTGAMGSWFYAAPELLQRPQDADARAAVYGLGMTTVFGLHGADLTMDVVRDAKGFIDKLSCKEAVKAVLKQAVEWEPGARFPDASSFCESLQHARTQVLPNPVAVARDATPVEAPRPRLTDAERELEAIRMATQALRTITQRGAIQTTELDPAEVAPAERSKGVSPATTTSRPSVPRDADERAAGGIRETPSRQRITVDARDFVRKSNAIWTFSFYADQNAFDFLTRIWSKLRSAGAATPPLTYGQTWILFDPRTRLTIKQGSVEEARTLSLWDAGIRPGTELWVISPQSVPPRSS